MSSTNRSRVKAGKRAGVALCALLGVALAALPVRAADLGQNFWFAGTRLTFDHAQSPNGVLAVATDDSGLTRFLGKLGATVAYQSGQNYVVVTTADRRTITFTLGDTRFSAGGVVQGAAFAPYAAGAVAFLPFIDLARALAVVPVDDPATATTVLQPQLAMLDVRTDGRLTVVTLRGAGPLHFRRTSGPADPRFSLTFAGVASTLEAQRQVRAPGLRALTITVGGTPRNPISVVDFDVPAGGAHVLAPNDAPNAVAIAFGPPGAALGGTAIPSEGDASLATAPLLGRDPRGPAAFVNSPPAQSAPSRVAVRATPAPVVQNAATPLPLATAPPADENGGPSAAAPNPATAATPTAQGLPLASVTAVQPAQTDGGLALHVAMSGPVTFEWHRLDDNRWYVDLKPAVLAMAAVDQDVDNEAVQSLRVKAFVGPNDRLQTVRIALTLSSPRVVTIVPADGGMTIAVDRNDDADPQKTGLGELSGGRVTGTIVAPPAAPPLAAPEPEPTWKFAPPASANPKLIVIDPGHGGSDTGAMHNGLVEKDLNLDISRRLRTLLVARGWQVRMTRDSDVDVFAPNDSAHDELQARCDIANNAGARMFISVHSNSFTTSALSGTTTYFFRADSYGLAQAIHARLAAALPTKDDGVRKENFYVIHHTTMPAVLVETAFLSNPGDAALLHSGDFLQKIAGEIANGVGDYAGTSQPLTSNATTDGS